MTDSTETNAEAFPSRVEIEALVAVLQLDPDGITMQDTTKIAIVLEGYLNQSARVAELEALCERYKVHNDELLAKQGDLVEEIVHLKAKRPPRSPTFGDALSLTFAQPEQVVEVKPLGWGKIDYFVQRAGPYVIKKAPSEKNYRLLVGDDWLATEDDWRDLKPIAQEHHEGYTLHLKPRRALPVDQQG